MGPVSRLEFPHQVVRSRFKEGKSIPSEQLVHLLLSLTVMAIITCSSSLPFDWLLGIQPGRCRESWDFLISMAQNVS